ncbi:MAG TPA: thioredoxin-like domain-containing protein [Cyclobacteriaceae bacterium]|nr:thioredoxin-like domain-containing protein [Cyclobacteriaceae bacterium]
MLASSQTLIEGQISNYSNKEVSLSSLDNSFGDISNVIIRTNEEGFFSVNLGLMAPSYLRINFQSDKSFDYLFFPLDTVSVKVDFESFNNSLQINNIYTYQIDSSKVQIIEDIDSIIDLSGNLDRDQIYFIDFWATWCGPCLIEQKIIKPLLSKIRFENVIYISLDNANKNKVWKNYIYKNQLSGLHILAGDSLKNEIVNDYRVGSLPAYGIIRNGELVLMEIKLSDKGNLYEKSSIRAFEIVKQLNELKQ